MSYFSIYSGKYHKCLIQSRLVEHTNFWKSASKMLQHLVVIQPYEFPRYFEIGHGITDLISDFCGHVYVSSTQMNKFLLLHSGYSFVSRVSISAYLPFWHRIVRTLLILDNSVYQTSWKKYYKSFPFHTKTLQIRLTELLINILNSNTAFWKCKKNPITFEQVYNSLYLQKYF